MLVEARFSCEFQDPSTAHQGLEEMWRLYDLVRESQRNSELSDPDSDAARAALEIGYVGVVGLAINDSPIGDFVPYHHVKRRPLAGADIRNDTYFGGLRVDDANRESLLRALGGHPELNVVIPELETLPMGLVLTREQDAAIGEGNADPLLVRSRLLVASHSAGDILDEDTTTIRTITRNVCDLATRNPVRAFRSPQFPRLELDYDTDFGNQ